MARLVKQSLLCDVCGANCECSWDQINGWLGAVGWSTVEIKTVKSPEPFRRDGMPLFESVAKKDTCPACTSSIAIQLKATGAA